MGFTTPCFIRKNTKELQLRLKELGYVMFDSYMEGECLMVSPSDEELISSTPVCMALLFHTCLFFGKNIIDCGDNEELFLAIASLRDDSDKDQWFVIDTEIYIDLPKETWFKATDISGGKHIGIQIDTLYCHKATVEELIEHFKK